MDPGEGKSADGPGGPRGPLGGQREPEGDPKQQEGGFRGATKSLLRRECPSPSRGDPQAGGRGGSRRRPIGAGVRPPETEGASPRWGVPDGAESPRRSRPPRDPPVPQPRRKVGGFLGSSLRSASRAPTWSAGRAPWRACPAEPPTCSVHLPARGARGRPSVPPSVRARCKRNKRDHSKNQQNQKLVL